MFLGKIYIQPYPCEKCPEKRNTERLQDIVHIIQSKKYHPNSSQGHSLYK